MPHATGGCLCGGVRYEVRGPLRDVVGCHCRQCARTSGHHVAATKCRAADLALTASETLRWYRSSPEAERGFCGTCGSNLFWRAVPKASEAAGEEPGVSVMAGTLDQPTGLKVREHIFVGSKSDYYTIDDGMSQHETWWE